MTLNNIFRALVSTPKQSIYDSHSWLDLSHITTQLIVAAGPTDSVITSVYRSPIQKVVKYLEKQSKSGTANWHIWNFRAEGSGYAFDSVNYTYRPFPDHEPPSVVFLIQIISEIAGFLQMSPGNIALIHCKEGKGRSGTVCCAYLMYEAKKFGVLMSTEEAIAAFTRKRMRMTFGQGVSIRSQVRYLEYYKKFLSASDKAKEEFWAFHSIRHVPFDPVHSFIDKITIYECSPLFSLTNLTVSTYIEGSDGLALHTLREQRISPMATSRTQSIDLKIPLGHRIKDIRVAFGKQLCYAYTWFNLFYETYRPEVRVMDSIGVKGGRVVFNWKDFDGPHGFRLSSSLNMFERVEVSWVLHR